ncbi:MULTISPECIES: copper resistance system multicopper oxidase [Ralstonia]|jgi:CopA family copper-resistance protein|uniref:Copper resistance protein A n=14 Tax=Pseudomonadota TaxID=1224 RepID=A0AAD2ALV8_9RALS|nr:MULTISPECIES: copper resistance system multicopper oxidase [Ralstonia]KRP35753.1 MAG: copper resistance protein CopA [Opitutaceae bacterium BACL24 MAG-120322-bin51]MEE2979133.1 copper resistance system multicopper oxidase [Pseudomonadota bacterium]NOZ18203.1 copper resistance system multicopper oxidase [Betaproteobacteria bacterium]EFP63709.1 copper-resistance protein, CopA family [Ralstonia pickettii]EGY59603.1 CopA family copper-resistance protein [Ralstonia sp. 5_2_56FAA]
MRSNRASGLVLPNLPRRRFVQGLAAGGVIAGLGLGGFTSAASAASTALGTAPVLRGTEFDLVIDETPVNFTGKPAMATTINGMLPGPTLRWREGDTVTLRVTNRLREPTSIHWHGIVLPFEMDGVPGISFHGIPPGETFTYRFKVRQSGSYWYHSHSGFQEMTGVYGALIIDAAGGDAIRADRDYSVLLSDWTDEDPMRVLSKLKTQGDYYNYHQPTVVDFFRDVSNDGWKAAMEKRAMWNQMRMNPTDLADLSSATLTYLTNGVTPAGNWTGLFTPGETVRLRFINGSGNTFYDVRIPGLKLKVVQVDGQNIEPVTVDEFRFGPGETCDVLVAPKDDAYTIFSQSMDRTGYARGTLAVCRGLQAAVPALDKVEWLSMADMMGDMGGMGGMSHGGMSGMDHGAMSGMNHGGMPGMDHGDMQMMDDTGMTMMDSGGMQMMDHSQHAESGGAANSLKVPSKTARHARTEYGPSTDMHVDMARTNLDDPGVGLRNNGRRVLVLADMHTIGGPMDKRGPEREVELHLTGNMERYTWSFDGVEFGKSTPVHFRYGERLRVILHNDTMMTHPMHLHGMWSELEAPDGTFLARRHTIPVQPAQRISFLVTADALGRWAWHCHLMLHMDAGMFREVVVV